MITNQKAISAKQRKDLAASAKNAADQREQEDTAGLVREAADLALARGFDIDELMRAAIKQRSKVKAPPKYRDPANPENTWAGRGKKPNWLKAAVAEGKSEEDFLIKKP